MGVASKADIAITPWLLGDGLNDLCIDQWLLMSDRSEI
jgi:hypothetical protein